MNKNAEERSSQGNKTIKEHAPKIKGEPSDDDRLKEQEWESFPASDPPSHSPGSTQIEGLEPNKNKSPDKQ